MRKTIFGCRSHGAFHRTSLPALLLALVMLALQTAQAQVVRPFEIRAEFDERGDIELIGNVLLTCAPGGTPDCADVQDGTASDSNNRPMAYVNIDPGAGFDNSSSADLNLPPDATVLYAGLYWGGRADPADAGRGVLQFRVPGSASYETINASQIDTIIQAGEEDSRPYQALADVTSLVQAAGNGTYFAGDLTASLGQDGLGFYGGWSLIVIYQDNTQPFRRLSLFDGAANVAGTDSVTINVTGLLTPQAGSFDTFLGALVWEGDEIFTGDTFSLEGTLLSDTLNPVDNFWNSSITRLETRITAKNPDYVNQLAVDINYVDASGILANGATTAAIEFATDGDTYVPHALTFVVDIVNPNAPAGYDQILFPYFRSGNGKYTFLSLRGDGGRIPGSTNTLSYVFNYDDPSVGSCTHFDVRGSWTDFDLIQQTVIDPAFIFDGTDVSRDFGDASSPAYLPLAGETQGFLTVLDGSPEGGLGGQAIVIDPATGLVSAYRGINNPLSSPTHPDHTDPDVFGPHNAGNFSALGITSHLSHDLTWYPVDVVDTVWYVLVTGTDMDNRGGWRGAVRLTNGFGGVFDRDENFLSGTRTRDVVCFDFVEREELLNTAQLNATRMGGWGWFASIPQPNDFVTGNPVRATGSLIYKIEFSTELGTPATAISEENAYPNF